MVPIKGTSIHAVAAVPIAFISIGLHLTVACTKGVLRNSKIVFPLVLRKEAFMVLE